jgi:hypothetical protein
MSNLGAYSSEDIGGNLIAVSTRPTMKEASAHLQEVSERFGKAMIACGEAHGNDEVVAFRARVLSDLANDVAMAAHAFARAAHDKALSTPDT